MNFNNSWKVICGKFTQLSSLPLNQWGSFVLSWLRRKKNGSVACVIAGTKKIVQVDLKDFYESYVFFAEFALGQREIQFFLSKLKKGDVFFDIGGFRGVYSAATKARLGDESNVFIFEPLSNNCTSIERVCQLNQFNQFNLIRSAVGDGSPIKGCVNEIEGMLRSGDATASADSEFPSCSIDGFINNQNIHPTILKVDVDGFEWEVFQGAHDCLKKYHPRVWLEIHPGYLRNKGINWEDVVLFLKSQGYQITFFEDFDSADRDISFHLWCE